MLSSSTLLNGETLSSRYSSSFEEWAGSSSNRLQLDNRSFLVPLKYKIINGNELSKFGRYVPYCSLCVPRDQNNSRSVRMIPSSGKRA